MQVLAVILARALVFVDSFELNPKGAAFFPEVARSLVETCGFMKFPQKIEDFDEQKGVEFSTGKWGGVTIETLKIYRNGIMLDTRVSTDESKRIIGEALEWASSTFGVVYNPKMISRTGYVSNLIFQTDVPILGPDKSPASHLANRVHSSFTELTGDTIAWAPTILTLNSDTLPRKPLHAPFTIQRRADATFAENKYYSEAPLPTRTHIELLNEFEAGVRASSPR
ncbi:MAG TPA: hypothetical protein VGD60_15885 [Candidatus Acidoferrales bacterium]